MLHPVIVGLRAGFGSLPALVTTIVGDVKEVFYSKKVRSVKWMLLLYGGAVT